MPGGALGVRDERILRYPVGVWRIGSASLPSGILRFEDLVGSRTSALSLKTIGSTTLISQIQASRRSSVDTFPIRIEADQLRQVTGMPTDADTWGKTITGAGGRYIPDEGALFEVERRHLDSLNALVNGLPVTRVRLPAARAREKEGPYNRRIATSIANAVLLDKATISRRDTERARHEPTRIATTPLPSLAHDPMQVRAQRGVLLVLPIAAENHMQPVSLSELQAIVDRPHRFYCGMKGDVLDLVPKAALAFARDTKRCNDVSGQTMDRRRCCGRSAR
jgi:hypothetical protein